MTPAPGRLRRSTLLAAIAVLAFVLPAALGLGEAEDIDDLPLHFYHASLSEGSSLLQEERVSTIEKPVYIPLDERQDTELKRAAAFRFAFTHLSPRKSRFILYPQSFATDAGVQFDQGALISTTADGFDSSFASIADQSNIDLGSAKALYDIRYYLPSAPPPLR
jgi:hypothetical protein